MSNDRRTAMAAKPVTPGNAHILVVEDKVDNYVTIAKLLIYSGVQPEQFGFKSSGLGVVQFADSLPNLDLILLDIGLPGENGYEVLRRIRDIPRFQATRVVAVTGHASREEMSKAQDAGFDGFLGKPLLADRFPKQLTRILAGEPVWEFC